MFEIIPGILEKDWGEIEKKIELVKPFAKTIQIDFADGKLVQNTTFLDLSPFSKYKDVLDLEAHLMVEEPVNYLRPLFDVGFKRFYGHIEKMSDQIEFVAQGQILGGVGLAIDSNTLVEEIKVPFDDLDGILIMTIQAGFSGQEFMEEMLDKVQKIRTKAPFLPIEVDGGVNDETIVLAREAGADKFVSTSFLFDKDKSVAEQYRILEKLVK